jgi:hypothetical protein
VSLTAASTAGDSRAPMEAGVSFIFDVYKGADGWHVHKTYE